MGRMVWNCFFGSVEKSDSSLMAAAIREMDEETTNRFSKVAISRVRRIGEIKIPLLFRSTFFIGKVNTTVLPELSFEFGKFEWFDLNYLPDNVHPGLRYLKSRIQDAIANDANYEGETKKFVPKVPPPKLRLRGRANKGNRGSKKKVYLKNLSASVPFLGPVWNREDDSGQNYGDVYNM